MKYEIIKIKENKKLKHSYIIKLKNTSNIELDMVVSQGNPDLVMYYDDIKTKNKSKDELKVIFQTQKNDLNTIQQTIINYISNNINQFNKLDSQIISNSIHNKTWLELV